MAGLCVFASVSGSEVDSMPERFMETIESVHVALGSIGVGDILGSISGENNSRLVRLISGPSMTVVKGSNQ